MHSREIERYCDLFEQRLKAGESLTAESFLKEHSLPIDVGLLDELRKLEHEYRPAAYAPTNLAPPPGPHSEPPPQPLLESVGSMIGGYKLLQKLGEGGMGVVYMAEQSLPVYRRAALKIIKPGMDSHEVIARFEAERQALAMMDHPNIARVVDAGTTPGGRPYFVMELVKGIPITRYCDERHLAPKERLELFIPVCHAVQHAHQKGIIHRDIKPSNILVAHHDDRPVPKIIDFGVAKAISQRLTEKTMFTQFGQIVGTIDYMSPEQAKFNQLDVDTRTDIYSLGVLLYELLTGETPFDKKRLHTVAFDEMVRIIQHEEPPRPSARLTGSVSLPGIAANRHTDPRRLSLLVRGDLDWIVMKALEKDRTRRYETANALALDVHRHLNSEPVSAGPPSATYRIRKFVRRNQRAIAIAGALLLGLIIAGGAVGWAIRDRAAREDRLTAKVSTILDEVSRLEQSQNWTDALTIARRAQALTTEGQVRDDVEKQVNALVQDLEFVQRLNAIREQRITFTGLSFDHAGAISAYLAEFRNFGVELESLPPVEAADRLSQSSSIILPITAAIDELCDTRHFLYGSPDSTCVLLAEITNRLDPEPVRSQLRATWSRIGTPETNSELRALAESVDVAEQSPATLLLLEHTLLQSDLRDEARLLTTRAQQQYSNDFWINYALGARLFGIGDYAGAARYFTAAVALRPSAPVVHLDLGVALLKCSRPEDAAECFRSAIRIDPKFFYAHLYLGQLLNSEGRFEQAEEALRIATNLQPTWAPAQFELGMVFMEQDKLDESETRFRTALELDSEFADAHFQLARLLEKQGKLDEAEDHYRSAAEINPELDLKRDEQ